MVRERLLMLDASWSKGERAGAKRAFDAVAALGNGGWGLKLCLGRWPCGL